MNRHDSKVARSPSVERRSVVALSAVMVAKDAAATIADALASVRFCDEVIVIVDASSTDETETIARELADRVDVRPWPGYGRAKRAAVALAQGHWVLIIDADEMVTPELAASISAVTREPESASAAYRLRRRTRFLGRWMRHGDWGRDRVTRLFQRDRAEVSEDPVHESVAVSGPTPVLDGLLMHEGDRTLSTYLDRLDRYTTLAAESLHQNGRRASWPALVFRPAFKFVQACLLRLGFLDGWTGLILAWYSAVYVFTKYAKLRRLGQKGS